MKKNELRAKIIFRTDLITEEKFCRLWQYMADCPIGILKFDYSEPIKKTYTPSRQQAGDNYIKFLGAIYFRGKSMKNWIKLGHMISGFSILSIYADEVHRVENLIGWIKSLLNIFPLEYVSITDTAEYDLKHKEEGQHSFGWQGASDAEFLDYMPGVYWFNAFGESYINAVGKDHFKNLPDCGYVDLGDKMIAFHLNDALITKDYEKRIKNEQCIADKIGSSFFYDKFRDLSFSHPRQFVDYISVVAEKRKKMTERLRGKYS